MNSMAIIRLGTVWNSFQNLGNPRNLPTSMHVLDNFPHEFKNAVWSDLGDASNRQMDVVAIVSDQSLPPQINQVLSNSLEQLAS